MRRPRAPRTSRRTPRRGSRSGCAPYPAPALPTTKVRRWKERGVKYGAGRKGASLYSTCALVQILGGSGRRSPARRPPGHLEAVSESSSKPDAMPRGRRVGLRRPGGLREVVGWELGDATRRWSTDFRCEPAPTCPAGRSRYGAWPGSSPGPRPAGPDALFDFSRRRRYRRGGHTAGMTAIGGTPSGQPGVLPAGDDALGQAEAPPAGCDHAAGALPGGRGEPARPPRTALRTRRGPREGGRLLGARRGRDDEPGCLRGGHTGL